MKILLHSIFAAALVLPTFHALGRDGREAENEVQLSDEQFKALDQFESFALRKADKIFNDEKREYKQAAAEYEAFAMDNPRSKALPYALLRKARCLQLANRRNEAIKAFREVVDFFPDSKQFAGAALYYIGQTYWENGDSEKGLKAWAQMVEHPTYRKHYLAATALNMLAENLLKQDNAAKAMEYFQQVAVDFRRENPDAARKAINNFVIPYFVRKSPDEAALRKFYLKAGTFENDPHKIEEDPLKDKLYWTKVRESIERYGQFNEAQVDLRKTYYGYWAQQLQGKFSDWDDFQIDAAQYQLYADGDASAYAKRLDEQFQKNQKDGDYSRILKWIQAYSRQKNKVAEYYAKFDFSKMSNEQIRKLMELIYEKVNDPNLARNVCQKIRLNELNDEQKQHLVNYLYHRDEGQIKAICQAMSNPQFGQLVLLRYLHWKQDIAQAIPLCEQLKGVPEYTKEVLWKKGELHQHHQQYTEAIASFKECDNPPENLFRISECHVKLGQVNQAIEQLRQVENFFQPQAPEAALRIAHVYRDAGTKDKFESSLRAVLKKYPKSNQSSSAHQELEKLGVRIGGGVNAE